MCGIIGKAGTKNVMPDLLNGLKNLEYRGYDSSGISYFENDEINRVRSVGKVTALEKKLDDANKITTCGIGHTRWATHGEPTENNAHPHKSTDGKFYVVHNGIIENAEEIKRTLFSSEEYFESETDTEVFAHLLSKFYEDEPINAIAKSLAVLKGSYAFGILCSDFPQVIFAASSGSPLVVVEGEDGNYVASDSCAVRNKKRMYRLGNGEICRITKNDVRFFDPLGKEITKNEDELFNESDSIGKGDYAHFMLKEIYEQPEAVRQTVSSFVKMGSITFPDVMLDEEFIASELQKIVIVGCGSAYHTGMIGERVINKLGGVPCYTQIASEFRYSNPSIDENTLVIFVSQSGETADTIASLRLAKHCRAKVLSIVNSRQSTMARESDNVIFTKAGKEIAVATTKAYSAQLVSFYALAIYIARLKKKMDAFEEGKYVTELCLLHEKISETLKNTEEQAQTLAKKLVNEKNVFFIGRLSDYATACEGALKLKEVSYLNCQSYAAGELKHGTISLIEKDSYVMAIASESKIFRKTISNLCETQARGAKTVVFTDDAKRSLVPRFSVVVSVCNTLPEYTSSLLCLPLQLMAYYTALYKNCDIDKPRNLAKSVTVE